jgi:hypothetical protein
LLRHDGRVGWITKSKPKPTVAAPRPQTRGSEGFYLPVALQQRIADLLVKHNRFVYTEGHLRLHILGTTQHHDGSTDYMVRTAIREANGRETVYSSHVRMYPTDHLRLIR